MSGWLARIGAAFVEPAEPSHAAARLLTAPGGSPALTVVVLCAPGRARAAAAVVAMATARSLTAPCAVAAVVGCGAFTQSSALATLAARRVAAGLRTRGEHASASGRLVWLADRRAAAPDDMVVGDPAAAAAAMSADLGRAAGATGVPAVLAIPLARTAALDRVIAWHDAVLAVREPDATTAVVDRVLASLAALGRPCSWMAPPSRHAAAAARAGLWTSPFALRALDQLGFGASTDVLTA